MAPRRLLVAAALALCAAGCGRSFDVKTAPGLVELDDQGPRYQYRAIAPEGVVYAVHSIDIGDKKGGLEFWVRACVLRMRQLDGYALLGQAAVKTRDGTVGRELRFGHDQGREYLYTLRIFAKQGRLYLVEVGGPSEEVVHYQDGLDWMHGTLRLD